MLPFLQLFRQKVEDNVLKSELKETISEKQNGKVSFDELKKINPDLVAILYLEGTDMYLPIVQTTNNDYYLNHSFNGGYSDYGAIFMDCRSNSDFSSRNTFIYGHSVLYGGTWEMFTFLRQYMNEDFYHQYPSFKIVTEDREFSADVVSAYKAAGNSDSYQPEINDEDSYSNYLNLIKNKSNYQTDADVTCEENLVTLYTCSLEGITRMDQLHLNQDRYFVHLVLHENIDTVK